ncbi:uncharacterized protein LOC144428184 [Styela clava]|uniref:protein kinase C-like 1B n=1 Tax=Styela clava TaxID=7725 RepID=UPI001939E352|nr:protein kinase C-like 1B [Styela clava]
MDSYAEHNFQWYNYKRPTFCDHCGGLLVGATKQGKRCRRCDLDIHEKCEEILEKPCIELVTGHHNFREKTFTQLTYCDFCKNLLVGFIRQGMKCSECGANVHEKCQEKVEAFCRQTQSRLNRETVPKTKPPRSPSPRPKSPLPPSEFRVDQPADFQVMKPKSRTPSVSRYSDDMDSYPECDHDSIGTSSLSRQASSTTGASSRHDSTNTPNTSYPSTSSEEPNKIEQMKQTVDDVFGIMKNTFNSALHRGENLDKLQKKSKDLEERANLLEKTAKKVKYKMMWKNYKLWVALAVAAIILIVIISVAVVFSKKTS